VFPSLSAASHGTADIMIKPDGVQRGLVGAIVKRFEDKGFKLVAMKLTAPGKEHMEMHYEDLKDKKFFPGLISYMTSGPVVAMVWEGKDATKEGRKMLGMGYKYILCVYVFGVARDFRSN
jgi:nucleoside-diphosphate kinase